MKKKEIFVLIITAVAYVLWIIVFKTIPPLPAP